jgi:hypothetical protein
MAMTTAQLKKKYAPLVKGLSPVAAPPRPLKPGELTEVERALLVRNVIDALRSKPDAPAFSVWRGRKYGHSRLYFGDHSWLGYDRGGKCLYGPDKTGTAYAVRNRLGLETAAEKGALL